MCDDAVMATSGRPTIADVAALAGVSRTAVSHVFNSTGSISAATAERIREAARKLNWTPSSAAVALRRARAQAIGLVSTRGEGQYELGLATEALISGIESVLSPREYGLLLYEFHGDRDREAAFYRKLADARRVDGVVLIDSFVGDARFDLVRELNLPAVLLGTPWRPDPILHVDPSSAGAGVGESVRHLLELGHRTIAYVGGPDVRSQALARRVRFEKTMGEAGILPVAVVETDYSPRDGARVTGELLELADRPTAIVYGSDLMAIAGMQVARRRGMRLPQDLSVVGFDGLMIGELMEPELTTVRRDPVGRGRAAASMLLRLLGEDVEQHPVPAQELVVRRSTAPPHRA